MFLYLCDVRFALDVHLQVGAEHHQGVDQTRLKYGVVQTKQHVVGSPRRLNISRVGKNPGLKKFLLIFLKFELIFVSVEPVFNNQEKQGRIET